MELKKALQIALDFEKEGQQAYAEAAQSSHNKIVKHTFTYLAKQELFHIGEIQKYMKDNKVELGGDKPEQVKSFFKETIKRLKQEIKLTLNDEDTLKLAMGLEQEAYDFYKTEAKEFRDSEVKKFFEFIAEQENSHYLLIQKSLNFIKDPQGFMTTEEEWMFEG